MSSTIRSGAVYGIGRYGDIRYGVSNVTYIPDGVSVTATSDSGVVIIGDANHVVVGVSMSAAVSSVGVVGVAVTSVAGVEATASIGDNVSFKLDCKFTPAGVEAQSSVGALTVVAKAVVVATGVSSNALLSSRILEIPTIQTWANIRFGWYLSNTFVYFYINATSWNAWVDENVEVGHTIYATVGGVRKYYGVVTDLPVVSGISGGPQTLITVSNPEGHSGFIDQNCTFEVIQPNNIVYADANVLPSGVESAVYLGTPTQKTVNRIPVDGISVTTSVGNVTIVAESNTVLVGVESNVTIGTVEVTADANTDITGVSASVSVGNVSFILDCQFEIAGHGITGNVGAVVVTTTVYVFDPDAFDRQRVVYVERRASSSERTVRVEQQNRTVMVERRPDVFDRYAYIDEEVRQTYIPRRSTSYERTVRIP